MFLHSQISMIGTLPHEDVVWIWDIIWGRRERRDKVSSYVMSMVRYELQEFTNEAFDGIGISN